MKKKLLNEKMLRNIKNFEQKINYEFKNKNYILEALTHSSYSNENKSFDFNERLEFLGDSVLGIVISDYLFENEKYLPEGELTKIRANIVCEESLSEVAKNIDLGSFMFLGKGEEGTGGRERVSILADGFEAVIASIYLDSGLSDAKKFILKNMKDIIKRSREGKLFRDYKTYLQEILQINGKVAIEYKLADEKGPDHNKRFIMQVFVNDKLLGFGEGKSKKEAEQIAAKNAIEKIEN